MPAWPSSFGLPSSAQKCSIPSGHFAHQLMPYRACVDRNRTMPLEFRFLSNINFYSLPYRKFLTTIVILYIHILTSSKYGIGISGGEGITDTNLNCNKTGVDDIQINTSAIFQELSEAKIFNHNIIRTSIH